MLKESKDQAFVMTRIFDASRVVVFKAWTKPGHLKHWWGRKDFIMPVCEVDLRTGGGFRFCMRSPEGVDYWVKGVYQEIVAPARIVFRYALEGHELNHDSLATVTFEEQGDKTRMTLHQVLLDLRQGRKDAAEGWIQGLESLEKYLQHNNR